MYPTGVITSFLMESCLTLCGQSCLLSACCACMLGSKHHRAGLCLCKMVMRPFTRSFTSRSSLWIMRPLYMLSMLARLHGIESNTPTTSQPGGAPASFAHHATGWAQSPYVLQQAECMCHIWRAVLCQATLFMIMRGLTAAILLLIASLFWLCMLPLLWRLSDVVFCHLD